MRTKRGLMAAMLALAIAAGCGSAKSAQEAPVSLGTGTATVELFVNGQAVATVRQQDLRGQRTLASWLPAEAQDPAMWQWLGATSRRDAKLHLPTPTMRYGEHDFALFTDTAGQLALGIFRKPVVGMSAEDRLAHAKPVMALGDAARIEVWTRPKPSDEIAGYALVVRTAAGEIELTKRELEMLPRVPLVAELGPRERAPGESNRDRQKAAGWQLQDVMAAAKLVGASSVVVVSADKQQTTVAAATSTLSVNRRGLFSVYTLAANGGIERIRNVIRLEPVKP